MRIALAGLLVAGCALVPRGLQAPYPAQPAAAGPDQAAAVPSGSAVVGAPAGLAFAPPTVETPAAGEAPLPGTGNVVIRVPWPERGAQLILEKTALLTISATGSAGYTKTIDLTPPNRTAEFRNVPAGSMALQATAYDSQSKVVGSASTTIAVESGAIKGAKLVLVGSGDPVTTSDLVPNWGGTGSQVLLSGTGFGTDPVKEPVKIYVGGQAVLSADIFRTGPTAVYFNIPEWATRSAVVINVAGRTATASKELYRLAGIAISPASATLSAGATASFSAVGTDLFGGTWPNTPVIWSVGKGTDSSTHDHGTDWGAHGTPAVVINSVGKLTANATGDFHAMAKTGVLMATATITVQ